MTDEEKKVAFKDEFDKKNAIYSVPIEVIVSVGKSYPLIGEMINLKQDSIIPLDSKIEDPVEIRVGGKVIAKGELQETEDGSGRLSVRMTEILDANII